MSSTITNTSANININFPEPGKDNPSQGFRENFSQIQQAFAVAGGEVSDLQTNAVRIDQQNDFGLVGVIKKAKIQYSGFAANNTGATTGNLDYSQANYYKVALTTATSTISFQVNNWPAPTDPNSQLFAQLRLEVITPNAEVVSSVSFLAPGGVIRSVAANVTLPDLLTANATHVYDLWSSDRGTTVFVNKVGGPFA